MLLLGLPGKLYKHCYNNIAFFLDRPLPAFTNIRRPSDFIIHFLAQNNKNKKYKNPLYMYLFIYLTYITR